MYKSNYKCHEIQQKFTKERYVFLLILVIKCDNVEVRQKEEAEEDGEINGAGGSRREERRRRCEKTQSDSRGSNRDDFIGI